MVVLIGTIVKQIFLALKSLALDLGNFTMF